MAENATPSPPLLKVLRSAPIKTPVDKRLPEFVTLYDLVLPQQHPAPRQGKIRAEKCQCSPGKTLLSPIKFWAAIFERAWFGRFCLDPWRAAYLISEPGRTCSVGLARP